MAKLASLLSTLLVLIAAVAFSGIVAKASKAGPCDDPPEMTEIIVMGDWIAWSSQGPIIAAQLNDYYTDEGLEVELMSPPHAGDAIKYAATERVAFSMSYVADVLIARDEGIPIISVAALMRRMPLGLAVVGDSGIKTVQDLKGKTLGVNPYPFALAGLRTLLKSAGLTEDDVKVVDPGFGYWQLLMTNKIDAGYGLDTADPPVLNPMLAKEGRPPVEWFLYRDYGVPDFYYEVLVTSENWAQKNPAAACRFLRATRKGLEEFSREPEPVNVEISIRNEVYTLVQHRALTEGTMGEWKDAKGNAFIQDASIWAAARDWAVEYELISEGLDASKYFTNEYLR